jgi:transposase
MSRHGQVTSLQERIDIGERSAAGMSDAEIATVLGWSVWTVRKWRRMEHQQGRAGLAPKRGRPATGR